MKKYEHDLKMNSYENHNMIEIISILHQHHKKKKKKKSIFTIEKKCNSRRNRKSDLRIYRDESLYLLNRLTEQQWNDNRKKKHCFEIQDN